MDRWKKMNILAFESSCDETSAAVVCREGDVFTVKSNIIASQVETHKLYGGVVPEIASRAHIEAISSITYEALAVAGVTMDDIDAVAVTANPGLIGALLVGVNFAKALAIANGKPLVPVDHIKGHIATCYLDKDGNVPTPPFIALAVSGGHTGIYLVEDYNSFKLVGSTRDDAIGESFDKIGRIIGIPYPAGKGFDALSKEGFDKAVGECPDYLKKYKKSEAYKSGEFTLPDLTKSVSFVLGVLKSEKAKKLRQESGKILIKKRPPKRSFLYVFDFIRLNPFWKKGFPTNSWRCCLQSTFRKIQK